jgi:hypothetical protein
VHPDKQALVDDTTDLQRQRRWSAISWGTEQLYRSMRTDEVRRVRAAFQGDRDEPGAKPHTIAFAEARLQLLDRILAERARP